MIGGFDGVAPFGEGDDSLDVIFVDEGAAMDAEEDAGVEPLFKSF